MLIETKTVDDVRAIINLDNVTMMYEVADEKMRLWFISKEYTMINESYESLIEKIKSGQNK